MNRVLLTTFPSAYLHQGGGEREMLLLKEALEMSGIVADIYGPASRDVSNYKIAVHFSLVRGSESIIQSLSEEGVKLVLWPNLWFASPPLAEQLQTVELMLTYFDAIVFRSQTEENHFREYFDIDRKKIIRSSFIVSRKFKNVSVSNVFRESYGFERYAIWPGIIEPVKNQLSAVRAFNDLNINLVISGRVRDVAYLGLCKSIAKQNVHFIPEMPFGSEVHLSALKNSELFIELPYDFPGTSALEAATVGCRMLLSKSQWTEEVVGDACHTVDVGDIDAIRKKVQEIICSKEKKSLNIDWLDQACAVKNLINYIESDDQ